MFKRLVTGLAAFTLAAQFGPPAVAAVDEPSGKFEWSTKSAEAKALLADLQARIENFQFGPEIVAAAQKLVAADPEWAMGEYYLSAVMPPPGNQAHLGRAVELSAKASASEQRFIATMVVARANGGAGFAEATPLLEKLASDFPKERLARAILGQMYQGANDPDKARAAFEQALAIGPPSNRMLAFLANGDLLAGDYPKALATFATVEKALPKGAVPFPVRYGQTFAYLYEGKVDPALDSLKTYLAEYRDAGANQGFPEVFIWNSIARINLENGRLDDALKAYASGYESVPGSSLPDDQKQVWLGRLHHGRCRTLAKMGKQQEAWTEAQTLKKMIDEGGEAGKQYLPAWHYLAGYLKLEAGDYRAAVEELKQANPQDPFHTLLLARAYEKLGDAQSAKKTYLLVVESKNNGLERALAYPEAKRKLGA
jgi:tetratricopeptide (TPR) repeat protein